MSAVHHADLHELNWHTGSAMTGCFQGRHLPDHTQPWQTIRLCCMTRYEYS